MSFNIHLKKSMWSTRIGRITPIKNLHLKTVHDCASPDTPQVGPGGELKKLCVCRRNHTPTSRLSDSTSWWRSLLITDCIFTDRTVSTLGLSWSLSDDVNCNRSSHSCERSSFREFDVYPGGGELHQGSPSRRAVVPVQRPHTTIEAKDFKKSFEFFRLHGLLDLTTLIFEWQ